MGGDRARTITDQMLMTPGKFEELASRFRDVVEEGPIEDTEKEEHSGSINSNGKNYVANM